MQNVFILEIPNVSSKIFPTACINRFHTYINREDHAVCYTLTQTSVGDPRQCNSLVITASDDNQNEMPSWGEEGGGGI